MTDPIFTVDHIDVWSNELDARKPRPLPDIGWEHLPDIASFASSATNCGMAFRFAARDGTEYAFILNPVVAREIASHILSKGIQAGWLNGKDGRVCVPKPKRDA